MDINFPIKDTLNIVSEINQDYLPYIKELEINFLHGRIKSFMKSHNLLDSREFLQKVHSEKFFAEWFINSLSFNETELFRDVSFWDKLGEIIHQFEEGFRILLPISNLGPELYSLLILLKQKGFIDKCEIYVQCNTQKEIQKIKQGQVSQKMIVVSQKNFEESNLKINLENFFSKNTNEPIINRELLENCFFFSGNLPEEKEIREFDLVIARNKLLYLNEGMHIKMIENIDSWVKSGGYLTLGSLEKLLNKEVEEKYDLVYIGEKIFRKRQVLKKR